MLDAHQFYIGGEWVDPLGTERVIVRNPADLSVIGSASSSAWLGAVV